MGGSYALDSLRSFVAFVVPGIGVVLYIGRLYSHSVIAGHRDGFDPRHPRAKSHITSLEAYQGKKMTNRVSRTGIVRCSYFRLTSLFNAM
jgi:hypothetical protein